MNENNAPGKRLGKTMLTLSWVILLAGLTYFFGVFEEKRYNPNQNPDSLSTNQYKEIILTRNAYNHYVTSGKINGINVTFMLDTGATHVAVPAHLAKKLSLRPGAPMIVSTANGKAEVRATEIAQLELGPIRINNVRASLTPGMHDDEILLGMSVLKQLEFTQSGNQLTLRQYFAD